MEFQGIYTHMKNKILLFIKDIEDVLPRGIWMIVSIIGAVKIVSWALGFDTQ